VASRRAQVRVAAAQVRERLAQRRQLEEDVLTRAGAAMVLAGELHAQAATADAERDRLFAVAGWVLRPEDAAAVLGLTTQRVRAARKVFRSEREALGAVAFVATAAAEDTRGRGGSAVLGVAGPARSGPVATVEVI